MARASALPPPVAGRGATRNEASRRFDARQREADGDWLDDRETVDGAAPPLRTTVQPLAARAIITYNRSPDVAFDRSINPLVGCEHGCIYCFARPTHAFHDLSPGLDFESRLFVKPDAAQLLAKEIAAPGYRCRPIAFGTNTDPYQPIEARHRITRACLEVLAAARHPFTITTKSDRVLADLDLIKPAAREGLAMVVLSVTSLDPAVARTLEPRAPHPERRIAAIARLAEAGVPVLMSIAPVVPHITDGDIEALIARGAAAGARSFGFIPVRLPHEVAPLFRAWLDAHHPDRAAKVMATIRSIRGGGRDNDPAFFTRMRGQGPWADLIAQRVALAIRRAGLVRERTTLRTDLFRPPQPAGTQLTLL